MKKHLRLVIATLIATATIGAATLALAKTGNPCCANTTSACCATQQTCCQ